VDAASTGNGIQAPHPMPRAQSNDVAGDALRNDQRQDGTSVEIPGTKTDRSRDNLGTPADAPVPFEESDKEVVREVKRTADAASALAVFFRGNKKCGVKILRFLSPRLLLPPCLCVLHRRRQAVLAD